MASSTTITTNGVYVSGGTLTSQGDITAGDAGINVVPGADATLNVTGGLLVSGGDGGGNWIGGGEIAVGDGSMGGNSTPGTMNISGGTVQVGTDAGGGAGLQVGANGGNGIVNQSGGVVTVLTAGYTGFFDIGGGGAFGFGGGYGEYNLSGGTLNTGNNPGGQWGNFTQVGSYGTGVVTVSGNGVWNIATDGSGGASGLLSIGCGSGPDYDSPATAASISSADRQRRGGITVGNV